MNKIKIFADSTSDIPAHWRQQYEISIVPLYTVFGDEALQDGVNIHPEQLFQRVSREDIYRVPPHLLRRILFKPLRPT